MRRGSLQLSINAIVVLILAITILGLGLGFVKQQFSTASEYFEVADAELQAQIMDDLRKSGSLVTIKEVEFEVTSGDPYEFYFGIRNTDEARTCVFQVEFNCLGSSTNAAGCQDSIIDRDSDGIWDWFETFQSVTLAPSESKALFATLQVQSPADQYTGRMNVLKCVDGTGVCDDCSSGITELYDSKTFYVVVG